MSGIVVTKASPVLVVPSSDYSSPTDGDTDTTVTLSSFDKCVVPFPVTVLLTYDRPIHKPAETVKKALARALVHYRPFAGRLVTGAAGEVICLSCTGEGVTFVAASASSTLELEGVATSTALLKDLAVYYPENLCRDADPLLLVQVTEFSCGGFVLGVTWNHAAADGTGMAQFLQAVGELARGVSPASVVPVRRWDESLPGLPASIVSAQKSMMDHTTQDDLAQLDVTVPGSLVRRVKAETGATTYEAITAVLWRCRTRAVMSLSQGQEDGGPKSPASLMFPCNMRAHAGARDGYYGNCVVVELVPATKSAVAASSIADLVRLIRRAKEKAPHLLSGGSNTGSVDGDGDEAATDDGLAGEQPQQQVGWYDALTVTSWRNLGFDAVDLGGGSVPAWVTWYGERDGLPGCVVYPPCTLGNKDHDGAMGVSSVFVKPEHVDAFLGELASLATST